MNPVTIPLAKQELDFAIECGKVVKGLQSALRQVFSSLSRDMSRPTDLQNLLGVRASLAWQVYRFTKSQSPLEAVKFLPLSDAMQKFFEVAKRKSNVKASVEQATKAYDELQRFIEQHADDRETFDAMVLGLSDSDSGTIDIRARRAAFKANSQFWGLQASMLYRCMIVTGESPSPSAMAAIIQGAMGLRALRPKRDLPVCRRTITLTTDADPTEFAPKPLGVSILEDFCSEHLPKITTQMRGSVAHDYITLEKVGRTAAVDLFLSTKMASMLDEQESSMGLTTMVRVPCEEFVADLLIPAGLMHPASSRFRICGCLEDVSAAENATDAHSICKPQPGEYMGRDLDALHDKSFPRCPELLRFVLRDLGASRVNFDIFRCRIEYPMLHSCIGFDAYRTERVDKAQKAQSSSARTRKKNQDGL